MIPIVAKWGVDYTPVIFSFVEYTDRSRRYKQLKIQGKKRHGTSSSPHLGVLTPLSVLYDIYLKTKRKALVSSRHCDICSTISYTCSRNVLPPPGLPQSRLLPLLVPANSTRPFPAPISLQQKHVEEGETE